MQHQLLFAFILLLTGCAAKPPTQHVPPPYLTTPILNLEGEKVFLRDYLGKNTLIHFWAPWCFVCGPEMKSLNALSIISKDTNLVIIGISTADSLERTQKFVRDNKIQFPIFVDIESSIIESFDSRAIPMSVFLDNEGNQIEMQDPDSGASVRFIEGTREWRKFKIR